MDTNKSDAATLPDLQAYWMPFTANRQFKRDPRFVSEAQGMYYTTHTGRQVLDGVSGLWCCNAGHCHPHIVSAIQEQAAKLDYYTAFQMGYPRTFELANRLAEIAPEGLSRVFFANSGSEAVDTALKIAIAWHRVRGEGQRVRLIGREKGYHGVGFGGISVGGIAPNRKLFGALLPGVDHLRHTQDLEHQAYSRGQPEWGGHLADELERIVALHDASTIAAVILEPIACSGGVLMPPKGYLERIREICDRHGLLLIFDEVITGFGRTGEAFASQTFGVTPDLITIAKGLTSGSVPMGGVLVREQIYDDFMQGPEQLIEFAHGYTYSGHPLAVAAGHAALDVYPERGPVRARQGNGRGAGRRPAGAQGQALRDRHPRFLHAGRSRAGANPRQAHGPRPGSLSQLLRQRPAGPHHRRNRSPMPGTHRRRTTHHRNRRKASHLPRFPRLTPLGTRASSPRRGQDVPRSQGVTPSVPAFSRNAQRHISWENCAVYTISPSGLT